MATQAAGSVAKSKRERKAKDFEAEARGAAYRTAAGWYGFNAAALRNAMISACRFKMTMAKMSVFVVADGFDEAESTPLVRVQGDWEVSTMHTRNATGVVDVRARPMWRPRPVAQPPAPV